ncbi:universal stress protein [Actinoplanes sp. TBRC 11911]|uniref:universal stress protein n=1 Tax=Actinoplanes sp. TBRC 11911 TaxID=2729386 RepID=UPI00145D4B0B|nr:universal stress protein [Actinoplanes sp. TBRC 11911]NMO57252.1 universal stress protein [Actinoplanes sp. TBRC 11911]
MSHRDVITVGTDGTECGTKAVQWAATEAESRRLPLRIIYAYDWDWHESRYEIGTEYVDVARQLADQAANAAYRQARALAPHVDIEVNTLIGHAAPLLIEASRTAGLMVVGSRGRGGFAGLMLGSVSRRVATHASCPVVVVRGRPAADGPVVVGTDDSPAADLVLETAFEAADRQAAPLLVVRSYLPVIPLWLANVRPSDVPTAQQDENERTSLDEQLAPWRAKFPNVPVEVVLTHVSAAAALVEASQRGRLVIVGSHGHGVVAGALLGSAGLQLLHHADAPVMIVRARPED